MDEAAKPPGRVGYKSPPVEHRFKKGESGNPKGRPRKKPTVEANRQRTDLGLQADEVLLAEAYRPVRVREGERTYSMSALAAVFRGMGAAAMKGDRHARRLFTDCVRNAESRKQAELREAIEIVCSYKDRCYAAYYQADIAKRPRPDFVPHPDDVVLGSGGVPVFVGPVDQAHKKEWDKTRALIAAIRQEIEEFRNDARRSPSRVLGCHEEIAHNERFWRHLDFLCPDEETRRQHGYTSPTPETARAHREALRLKYRPFAELSPEEQEDAMDDLLPGRRRKKLKLVR